MLCRHPSGPSRRSFASWIAGGLPPVVAGPGMVLVAAAPVGPVGPMGLAAGGRGQQGHGQVGDLVAGERDHAGWRGWVCSARAATVRNARASIARVTHRCQEVQVRTWCSSKPASPLLAWKFSSMLQRIPAILTRVASGVQRGAAVEGQFAGVPVAADQQPVASRAAGLDDDPGPVIPALALGAGPGRQPLPGPGRQFGRQCVRAQRTGGGAHGVAFGHGQHIAQLPFLQPGS